MQEMMQITGRRTVPQIYIGERHVGGFDDLSALDAGGELEPLLAA
jgi:glutaredoxin 3